jgi:hypothetical protein
MILGAPAEETVPKELDEVLRDAPPMAPKFTLFGTLKTSQRNWRVWLSRTLKLRTREASNSKRPGFSTVSGDEQAYVPPFTVTVGVAPVQAVEVAGPGALQAPIWETFTP